MSLSRFPFALLYPALLLSTLAQAQNLAAIVNPPPEAPSITQAAQAC